MCVRQQQQGVSGACCKKGVTCVLLQLLQHMGGRAGGVWVGDGVCWQAPGRLALGSKGYALLSRAPPEQGWWSM